MPIVDADGHVMEPADLWTSRMSATRWRDWVPRYVAEDEDGRESWYFGGVRRVAGTGIFGCAAGFDPDALLSRSWKFTEGHAGGWDPVERLRVLDAEGIDTTVLYPTIALALGPLDPIPAVRDPEFVYDVQRAYNDWVAEYSAADRRRLFAMAAVPLQDVDRAVDETQRAVADLGLSGVFIRHSAYVDELPFSHHIYDPFWACCQELGVPVALHPATHVDMPNAVRKFGLIHADASMSVNNMSADEVRGGTAMSIAVGAPVDAIVALGRLLMGGVCERFPDLRILVLESGGGWVASILERMDAELKANPQERRWLSLKPSEYFSRQCWVSFEPDDPTLPRLADLIGTDRIVWASDFPHADAIYPGAAASVCRLVAGLDVADQRRIVGGNACEAYRLGAELAARP